MKLIKSKQRLILVLIAFLFSVYACEQRDFVRVEEIETKDAESIDVTTAIVKGTIIDVGEDGKIKEYGHCWSKTENPTIIDNKVNNGEIIQTGDFKSTLIGLEAATKYYIRAYLKKADGSYIYGKQIEITTTAPMPATVSGLSVKNIGVVSASFNAKIEKIGKGSTKINKRGFVWSTSTNMPETKDNEGMIDLGATTETGTFSEIIVSLKKQTKYYVRAFVENEAGIVYTETVTFDTKEPISNFSIPLVNVDGGKFDMGFLKYPSSKPIHSVTVSDFKISQIEITNEAFAKFINAYGSILVREGEYKGKLMFAVKNGLGGTNRTIKKVNGLWKTATEGMEQNPVVNITWYGAYEFCRFYGGKLPTEAQWEYAASGGKYSKGYMYSGSNNVNAVAWQNESPYFGNTHPVKTKKPNELGIYDMTGNAAELCRDYYKSDYYSVSPEFDPFCSIKNGNRVKRGGAWHQDHFNQEMRRRKAFSVEKNGNAYFDEYTGFRIVFE